MSLTDFLDKCESECMCVNYASTCKRNCTVNYVIQARVLNGSGRGGDKKNLSWNCAASFPITHIVNHSLSLSLSLSMMEYKKCIFLLLVIEKIREF